MDAMLRALPACLLTEWQAWYRIEAEDEQKAWKEATKGQKTPSRSRRVPRR